MLPQHAMKLRRLFFGRGLGFPYATMLLVAACVVTSLPLFFDTRYYLVLGIGYYDVDRLTVEWYHRLVTPFVHGGGFPGLSAHLAINCSLFLVLGTLTERVLGSGRFAAVTFASLAVQILLMEIITHGRGHGASGMTWSYPLFVGAILVFVGRRAGRRSLADPLFLLCGLLLVFEAIGLVKHWHLWNLLVSVPFFLAWRRTLIENLSRIACGEAPDRWRPVCNRLGIAVAAGLCLFTTSMTVAAVAGILH
jgi:membrane associated rhomboid family serine protease